MILKSTEAMQKFIAYINQNETIPVSVSNYVLSIFDEYILLSSVSDSKQVYLNDLFESAFVDKNSKSVNRVKKDLKNITDLLTKAHDLIHTTKAGEIILRNKNKKVQESIKSLISLSSLAEHENSVLEFQKGRGKSQEVTARRDMLSKLIFLSEYYGVHSKTTHEGEFYTITGMIYEILKIPVNNLNTDMNKARIKHIAEKNKNKVNFEFLILKMKNPQQNPL